MMYISPLDPWVPLEAYPTYLDDTPCLCRPLGVRPLVLRKGDLQLLWDKL